MDVNIFQIKGFAFELPNKSKNVRTELCKQ